MKKIFVFFLISFILFIAGCTNILQAPQQNKNETQRQPQQMCGGIAGIKCPDGYECQYNGNNPDAAGYCVQKKISK